MSSDNQPYRALLCAIIEQAIYDYFALRARVFRRGGNTQPGVYHESATAKKVLREYRDVCRWLFVDGGGLDGVMGVLGLPVERVRASVWAATSARDVAQ